MGDYMRNTGKKAMAISKNAKTAEKHGIMFGQAKKIETTRTKYTTRRDNYGTHQRRNSKKIPRQSQTVQAK